MNKIHRKIIFIVLALLSLPFMALLYAASQISDIWECKFDAMAKWAGVPEAAGSWELHVHMTDEEPK